MAQSKRPAENNIGNKNKKARTRGSSNNSPTKQQNHDVDDSAVELTETDQTSEESLSGMIDKLQNFQAQSASRKKWAIGFEGRVKQKKDEILAEIAAAKKQVVEDEQLFEQNMLGLLASLTTGLVLTPGEDMVLPGPLELEAPEPSAAMQKANELIKNCEALIKCYQSLCGTSNTMPPDSRIREVFLKDQQETKRAFEASKKMAINQLQARFADKTGQVEDRFTLDETEILLANRVMGYGKPDKHAEEDQEAEGMGTLLYGFGKVIGKMQALIEE